MPAPTNSLGGETEYERTLMLKIDQVLEMVQDLQARTRSMEQRQKEGLLEQEQKQGSF